jgi:hypothetical protein
MSCGSEMPRNPIFKFGHFNFHPFVNFGRNCFIKSTPDFVGSQISNIKKRIKTKTERVGSGGMKSWHSGPTSCHRRNFVESSKTLQKTLNGRVAFLLSADVRHRSLFSPSRGQMATVPTRFFS